jgi:hypothetical protein
VRARRGTARAACALLLAASTFPGTGRSADDKAPVPAGSPAAASASGPALEPKAMELLKAASDRLAAARTMSFTAVVSYENPSVFGPPLVYTTTSAVTVQRPDKLRVITPGDGQATEFYYDGKTMTAFAPAENLVAVADAPPTIDGALKAAYDDAAIYFPWSDVVVADPYADVSEGLRVAFYVGQSQVVGGVTTDMVAYANDGVFAQIWIGTDDKLPRRVRAVYREDPAQLRHQLDLSDWRLDVAVPADAFASPRVAGAARIAFDRPDPRLPPGFKPAPPPKGAPAKKPKAAKSATP